MELNKAINIQKVLDAIKGFKEMPLLNKLAWESAHESVSKKSEPCWLCDDYDTLCQIVCYLPKDNGGAIDIPINHCPICGRHV